MTLFPLIISSSNVTLACNFREDWSHAFYLGKLSEKLGYSHEMSFSFYAKAIALNPSAADSFYRMHASRLKLLCTCRKQDEEALKVGAFLKLALAPFCFLFYCDSYTCKQTMTRTGVY